MRYLTLILLANISLTFCYSQEDKHEDNELKTNEISVNVLYSIFGHPKISYEHLFYNSTGVGISLSYSFTEEAIYLERGAHDFSINPYYRLYFGKRNASGFFLQGGIEYFSETWEQRGVRPIGATTKGLGGNISTGGKFIMPNGWYCELLAGVTRGYIISDRIWNEGYGQFGISIGKRFW